MTTDHTPPAVNAVWVDGDPLMEAIAAAVWEHCDAYGGRSIITADPRSIAAVAAAVARTQPPTDHTPPADQTALRDRIAEAALEAVEAALGDTLLPAAREEALAGITAVLPPPADRADEIEALRKQYWASLRRADEINGALMEEVQRYAAGTEQPVLWSVYNTMHKRALNAESEVERLRADRAAVLDAESALIKRHCPDHGPADQDGVWMDCHCAVIDDMRKRANGLRRMADETQLADMRAWQQEWDGRPNGADVSDLIEVTPAARVVPCSGTLRSTHPPHNWEPQSGPRPPTVAGPPTGTRTARPQPRPTTEAPA